MTRFLIQNAGGQVIAPIRAAQSIHDSNLLGPIIFCSPELGRWSTVGGLGVMVDELSIGLADLGQDVYVISPYYERNRKGETGYLSRDPAGIHYRDNKNGSFFYRLSKLYIWLNSSLLYNTYNFLGIS